MGVLGNHRITWGHNIRGQGTCHRDDTGMSSLFFFFVLNYLFVNGVQQFQAFAFSCTSSILLCTYGYFLNVFCFLMMENK